MARARLVSVCALGTVIASLSVGIAWAGGPGGVVDDTDISRAVGSGVLNGTLAGFSAKGPTNDAATDAVVLACQQAGAEDCGRDEVTNDNLCIVSVGDDTGVVSGGAGPTIEAARDDAFRHAAEAGVAFAPDARILVSVCP